MLLSASGAISARKADARTAIESLLDQLHRSRRGVLALNLEGLLPGRMYAASRPQLRLVARLRHLHLATSTRLVLFTDRHWRRVVDCLGCKPPPEIWGVGGLERIMPDGHYEGPQVDAVQGQALDEACTLANQCGLGPWIEKKPGGLALRLDGFTQQDALVLGGRLWRPWSNLACLYRLRILDLRHGIELRIPGPTRKHALKTILTEIRSDTPVAYIGTDTSDEAAFDTLRHRGLRIMFGPGEQRTQADVILRRCDEVTDLLDSWAEAIPAHEAAGLLSTRA